MRRLVVVGASLAGHRAAQAARKAGFDGEIVMVGAEPHLPYTRPPLSKELLAGEHTVDKAHFPCDELGAEFRLGIAATGLDRQRRRVRLADGDEVPYDRLILATGSRPRPFPGPGAELANVVMLRTLDDALALRAAFDQRPRLTIVGAGFVGCEVASTARAAGLDVTLIDIAATPMPTLGAELGAWCAELHRSRGIDLRLGTGVAALRGSDRVQAVELGDGTLVETDLVLVGLGALPNTEWLTGSGLTADPGLACDATLTATGDSDILAAGDIVAWPHPLAGNDPIRIEHWTVAAEHGQLAGRNALLASAERQPYVQPPYFWSDQHGIKIQSLGLPARAQRFEVAEATPDGARIVYAGERDGRLIAMVGVGAARRLGFWRMALADPPPLAELLDTVAADPASLGAPSPTATR